MEQSAWVKGHKWPVLIEDSVSIKAPDPFISLGCKTRSALQGGKVIIHFAGDNYELLLIPSKIIILELGC